MTDPLDVGQGVSIPARELAFAYARSGGPGGQNVNKVSTRVELLFDVEASGALSADQKRAVRSALRTRIDETGVLHVRSDSSRSQWMNRQDALRKFARILAAALRPVKHRVASSPTRASRARRLTAKKRASLLKRTRGRIRPDD